MEFRIVGEVIAHDVVSLKRPSRGGVQPRDKSRSSSQSQTGWSPDCRMAFPHWGLRMVDPCVHQSLGVFDGRTWVVFRHAGKGNSTVQIVYPG
jgi:hypothetical protein